MSPPTFTIVCPQCGARGLTRTSFERHRRRSPACRAAVRTRVQAKDFWTGSPEGLRALTEDGRHCAAPDTPTWTAWHPGRRLLVDFPDPDTSTQIHKARVACAANLRFDVAGQSGPYPVGPAAWSFITDAHRWTRGLATDVGHLTFDAAVAQLDADLLDHLATKHGVRQASTSEGTLAQLAEVAVAGGGDATALPPAEIAAIGFMLRWHLPECDPRQPYPSTDYLRARLGGGKDIYQGAITHLAFWGVPPPPRTPPIDVT